jgi:hypothetical protein
VTAVRFVAIAVAAALYSGAACAETPGETIAREAMRCTALPVYDDAWLAKPRATFTVVVAASGAIADVTVTDYPPGREDLVRSLSRGIVGCAPYTDVPPGEHAVDYSTLPPLPPPIDPFKKRAP